MRTVRTICPGYSTKWTQSELNDERWSSDIYSLVVAELRGKAGDVDVQFIVEKDSSNFFMNGATAGGQFMDADSFIYAIGAGL